MNNLIIGNLIALIASLIMLWSGYIKNKKKILFFQTIQIGLSVISNIVLGGITGAIINAISFVRNIICYKDKLNKKWKVILIILSAGLTLYFNNLGLIGLLPLVSTIAYILLMDIKDVIKFKNLIIFTMTMWLIYDIYIMSYTAAVFDFGTIIANVISIYQIKNKNKKGE
jgi:hypothetical protein